MPLRDLAEWLLQDPAFTRKVGGIIIDAARSELPLARNEVLGEDDHDWPRLLFAASVLARVDSQDPLAASAHGAALQIAQYCLSRDSSDGGEAQTVTDGQRASAAAILSALANKPTLNLAVRRELLPADIQDLLPLPARMEWLRHELDYAVRLTSERDLSVNRFQRRLWTELEDHDWVSFSAPTSAGKSYIITQWVVDLVRRNRGATVVYLVPTRALIGEVEGELQRLVNEAGLREVTISSVPLATSLEDGANLLVYTQERYHILSTAVPDLTIDALIVDEAHKVGDGHRGVLLQQVIEHVARRSPDAKIVFASPMTSNPEVLVADAPEDVERAAFTSNEVTVAQNLLWVSQVRYHPRTWSVDLCLPSEIVDLGRISLESTPDRTTKRLSYVAHAMGEGKAGNILYVNVPSDAEKVAAQLYDLRGVHADVSSHPDIAALIDLVQKIIHPQFLLGSVIRRGIAFHYGNMPLLARSEVERLFSDGLIQYLVCTSTLVEGVNMACKTMFVRGPSKGRGRPMSAEDFWNLAGRAGRWGKEFLGNVVCVDARDSNVWGAEGAPRERKRYQIRRTADQVVSEVDELVAFIGANTPRRDATRRPDLEFVFAYLAGAHLRRGSIRELPWTRRLEGAAVDRVEESISEALVSLRTPLDVIERNPGISPLAMDRLLERFTRHTDDPEVLVPVDPASEEAVEVYRAVFGRIASELNAALGPPGPRSHALAILVTRWMSGIPLARLISDRLAYEGRRSSGRSLSSVIRLVLQDVEQIARFEAPRSLACYTDLLRVFLAEIGRPELIGTVPEDLNVMLELGVSRRTHIALMGLGLSRSSAIMLSEVITDDRMNEEAALSWLEEGLWRQLALPRLVSAEIERSLAIRRRARG